MLRPLLSSTFPQGFRISKNFGHPTSGSGGKIGLEKDYMKRGHHTNIHTNIQTNTHRDSMKASAQRADALKMDQIELNHQILTQIY